MSDLKTYLAAKYMSGPKADAILSRSSDPNAKKLRKKKVKNEDYIGGSASHKAENDGLKMKDEDEWKRGYGNDDDLEGEDAPVIGKAIATFQKGKSAWSTVGSTSLALPSAGPSSRTADDDVEVKPDPDAEPAATAPPPPVQMTKRKGGLRTAKQMQEEAERQAAENEPSPELPADGVHTQTVHRDASGRIVDVEKLKAEEREREREEERKKKEREEWSKGFVQRQNRQDRAREERQMADQDLGRSAGDAAMNREMRETERWNDPAAEFLSKKKKKGPKRPRYQGSYAPNRFGIPPGFRWDGVGRSLAQIAVGRSRADRSNGFEKKYFQYQNSASRLVYESNQYSMEDL